MAEGVGFQDKGSGCGVEGSSFRVGGLPRGALGRYVGRSESAP